MPERGLLKHEQFQNTESSSTKVFCVSMHLCRGYELALKEVEISGSGIYCSVSMDNGRV